MAQLLVQGLASKDRTMLRTVLQTEEADVIRTTVQALPVDAVLPLIDRLGYMLRFADQSFSGLKWLRAVMERHSSFLLTQSDLDSLLAPVYSSVQVRLRSYPRLLQLRGRLQLIAGQMAARQRQAAERAGAAADQPPLLAYQDDSSDDDGDLLGLPAHSPGDLSDMSEDDHPMEDEDASEDGSEPEDGEEPDSDDSDEDEDEDELMNGD
ncbi:ESF1 homolog [Pollicipes pollicipes]|uniref:ESF1 homolog n=1 Tax=Pollicipes pollicipes TaxID=41117 RepID=UPI001884C41E|nr:ESF1 homolog [Pollicipes pollicipes]